MSEEAAVEEETVLENEDVVEEEVAEEVEYSDVELEAMEQGWNPEGVEGKRNLSAEEFLDRKPLYDKMHNLEKKLKQQEKAVDAIQQHEKMVRKRMHEDHLKELKASKKAAFEEMDYDRVEAIDDEIYKAKKEHDEAAKPAPAVDTQEDVQVTLEAWVAKNSWYVEDKVMKRFAEGEGADFRAANPEANFDEVLNHISKTVKKEFPEKFQNMSRQKPSSVEGSATTSRRAPSTTKQKTVKDLPEEAIPVMKTLIRSGAFKTEQDYVNDYFNQ